MAGPPPALLHLRLRLLLVFDVKMFLITSSCYSISNQIRQFLLRFYIFASGPSWFVMPKSVSSQVHVIHIKSDSSISPALLHLRLRPLLQQWDLHQFHELVSYTTGGMLSIYTPLTVTYNGWTPSCASTSSPEAPLGL
ncbi:hypothetical protein J6590_011980 [Homalodisca vitripennis]|nr:hypothetical protein J6590_011980 [Homalodisca vitripennis]